MTVSLTVYKRSLLNSPHIATHSHSRVTGVTVSQLRSPKTQRITDTEIRNSEEGGVRSWKVSVHKICHNYTSTVKSFSLTTTYKFNKWKSNCILNICNCKQENLRNSKLFVYVDVYLVFVLDLVKIVKSFKGHE